MHQSGLFWPVWPCLTLFSPVWPFLAGMPYPIPETWALLWPPASISHIMAPAMLATFGHVGLTLAMFGYVWPVLGLILVPVLAGLGRQGPCRPQDTGPALDQ